MMPNLDIFFFLINILSFYPVSILIKVNIFGRKILIVDLTAILTHDEIFLDQSHRIAAKILPGLTAILNLFITKYTINITLLDKNLVNFFITHYYILYIDVLSSSIICPKFVYHDLITYYSHWIVNSPISCCCFLVIFDIASSLDCLVYLAIVL